MALTKKPRNSTEHAPAGSGDAGELAHAARHVREEHDAELRARDVEAVVLEIEGVAVHDAGLQRQPLVLRPRGEALHHHRRDVRGQHLRAEPRRRDGEPAAAGGNVQETGARPDLRQARALVAQPEVGGGDVGVVAARDVVPGVANALGRVRGRPLPIGQCLGHDDLLVRSGWYRAVRTRLRRERGAPLRGNHPNRAGRRHGEYPPWRDRRYQMSLCL